jgi:CIC family chloride channel protein
VKELPETLRRLVAAVYGWLHRNWRRALRVREHLRFREESIHLLLAGGIGILGALVNLFFYHLINLGQVLALARTTDLVTAAREMAPWLRVAVPTVGALIAGLVLYYGLRLVGRRGTPNLLEAVAAGDGRLPLRSAVVKSLSSIVSISTGASIGREGSITQLTATLASKFGQFVDFQPFRLRLLVACGAAAGIAAAYNAPIAGAVFAAQIVLGNFSMSLFAPLVFSSVAATVVSRTFFGMNPAYNVPVFEFTRLEQLPWFLPLAVLAGAVGGLFLRALDGSERLFQKLPLPIYARMMLGGLVVGALGLWLPEVWGNGYNVATQLIQMDSPLDWLLLLLLAKFAATALTVGSGTVGGVFTPTLFLGAALGSLFDAALNELGYARSIPNGVLALAGMGATLAATTHSPLLAMILVFEISLDYSLMPALMLVCVVASLVSRSLHHASVYTAPLQQRGLVSGEEPTDVGAATQRTVGELMLAPIAPVKHNTPLPDLGKRFVTSPNNFLPVVDDDQRLVGLVALQDMKEFLNAGQELRGVIAADVMRPPPACLTPGQRLIDAFPVLLASEQRNVPVVNSHAENRLIGCVSRGEALGLLSDAIAHSGEPKE